MESQSFKSIANPESNYQSFFDALKNVNTHSLMTNLMNLDKVLPHFIKLTNLVDLKVGPGEAKRTEK